MQSLMGADSGKLALLNEQNNMMDMITLRFSESTMYSVGDYALYFNGVFDGLYRFKEAKTTGAWDGSKVEQVSLAGILKQHESAISELNTRSFTAEYSQNLIPEYSNLDDYKTAGSYNCRTYEVAKTLKGIPTISEFASGFRLDVYGTTGSVTQVQKITVHDGIVKVFYRSRWSDTWNGWCKVDITLI